MAAESIELARFNMVEQQIRPWEVFDPKILNLLEEMPREDFVPEAYQHLAYADIEIPLGHEQHMMYPRMEARLLQALDIQPDDRVLEIGTGSGFLTACLARLAGSVLSIDIHQEFTDQAGDILDKSGIRNVQLRTGDALQTPLEADGPFDAIAVTGSLPTESLAETFRKQLKTGGRLFVITGEPPVMQAQLITRVSDESYRQETILETVQAPLENAQIPAVFEF